MSLPGIPKRNISLSDARQSAKASTANTASLKARAGELKSAQRTSVFTRALGSSGRGAGWVGAQRGFNPHDHISNKYYKDEYNINYKNKKKYNSYSSNECHSNNNRKDHHNHYRY